MWCINLVGFDKKWQKGKGEGEGNVDQIVGDVICERSPMPEHFFIYTYYICLNHTRTHPRCNWPLLAQKLNGQYDPLVGTGVLFFSQCQKYVSLHPSCRRHIYYDQYWHRTVLRTKTQYDDLSVSSCVYGHVYHSTPQISFNEKCTSVI